MPKFQKPCIKQVYLCQSILALLCNAQLKLQQHSQVSPQNWYQFSMHYLQDLFHARQPTYFFKFLELKVYLENLSTLLLSFKTSSMQWKKTYPIQVNQQAIFKPLPLDLRSCAAYCFFRRQNFFLCLQLYATGDLCQSNLKSNKGKPAQQFL